MLSDAKLAALRIKCLNEAEAPTLDEMIALFDTAREANALRERVRELEAELAAARSEIEDALDIPGSGVDHGDAPLAELLCVLIERLDAAIPRQDAAIALAEAVDRESPDSPPVSEGLCPACQAWLPTEGHARTCELLAFRAASQPPDVPRFCRYQERDAEGIYCSAHIHEAVTFPCRHTSLAEAKGQKFPCDVTPPEGGKCGRCKGQKTWRGKDDMERPSSECPDCGGTGKAKSSSIPPLPVPECPTCRELKGEGEVKIGKAKSEGANE